MATQVFTTGTQEIELLGSEVMKAQNELVFSTTSAISGNTIEALKIPAGAFVSNVCVYVETAEGSAATCEVGDGTDVDGWIDSVNLNSAAFNPSPVTAPYPAAGGKFYSAADTIDLTMGAASCSNAKVTVMAIYSIVE